MGVPVAGLMSGAPLASSVRSVADGTGTRSGDQGRVLCALTGEPCQRRSLRESTAQSGWIGSVAGACEPERRRCNAEIILAPHVFATSAVVPTKCSSMVLWNSSIQRS